MVEVIEGDLLDIKEGILLHQVNCMGRMGSGLAGYIRRKYPKVYDEFKEKSENTPREELYGQVQSVKLGDKLFVVNSYSQKYYGRSRDVKYTNEEMLINNIKKTVEVGTSKGLKVYIPYLIGCGLGNGDWDTIYEGIKDLDLTIIKKED